MSLDVSDCLSSYPALCDCLQRLSLQQIRSDLPKVVSLAFSVGAIEGLSVLQSWDKAQACHFYFEKNETSVLAVGEAIA